MLVTAVVTTYERLDLAKRAITSVLNQNHPKTELLVVEDGSKTGLKDWINNNISTDIKYHNNETNKGLAASRNWGINNATGEYIAFLDDDDEWKPSILNEAVANLNNLNSKGKSITGCISFGIELMKNHKTVAYGYQKNSGNLAKSIKSIGAFTLSSSSVYQVSALKKIGAFDETLKSSIDHDIWMSLANGGYSILTINKPLVTTHIDTRTRLTTDPINILSNLEAYLNKWLPTYQKWFGNQNGKDYANRYFAKVASNLAITHFIGGELSSFKVVAKTMFKKNPRIIENFTFLTESLLRETIFYKMPPYAISFIRKLLRKNKPAIR